MKQTYLALFGIVILLIMVVAGCSGSKESGQPANKEAAGTAQNKPAAAPAKDAVIVSLGGQPLITVESFKKELARRGPMPGQEITLEQKKQILDEMTKNEVLALKARQAGFDKDPEIQSIVKSRMVEKYLDSEMKKAATEGEITDEQINEYYEKHRAEYERPPMRRASMIKINKSDEGAKKKAQGLLKELKADPGEPKFRELAMKDSDDERTKPMGGELGHLMEGREMPGLDKAVSDAIWALPEQGSISDLLETDDGYYIVMLTGKMDFPKRSAEEMKEPIKAMIRSEQQRQKRDELVKNAAGDGQIKVDNAVLEAVKIEPGEMRGPEGPGMAPGHPRPMPPGMPPDRPRPMPPDRPAPPDRPVPPNRPVPPQPQAPAGEQK